MIHHSLLVIGRHRMSREGIDGHDSRFSPSLIFIARALRELFVVCFRVLAFPLWRSVADADVGVVWIFHKTLASAFSTSASTGR